MLWRLDSFFTLSPKSEKVDISQPVSNESNEKSSDTIRFHGENDENFVQEKEESINIQDSVLAEQNGEPEEENPIFSLVDIKYAEVIGLKAPFTIDEIKPSYRKLIAKYHPDRVAVMGEEIREVAEKKAKEINRAYDYFQKKFDLSWNKIAIDNSRLKLGIKSLLYQPF